MSDGRSAQIFHVLGWCLHPHPLFSLDQEQSTSNLEAKCRLSAAPFHWPVVLRCDLTWDSSNQFLFYSILFCFVLLTFLAVLHWKNYFSSQGKGYSCEALGDDEMAHLFHRIFWVRRDLQGWSSPTPKCCFMLSRFPTWCCDSSLYDVRTGWIGTVILLWWHKIWSW